MKRRTITLAIPTNDGVFVAHYSELGLAELGFPQRRTSRTGRTGEDWTPPAAVLAQIRRWHCLTAAAIQRVLAGRATGTLPPLDDSGGTEFQRAVWAAMRAIPTGQTRSYGEIARLIGRLKAVRAVGGACGANPIPVLVPCHRVIAANQKLGGFSGGLDWKRKLLGREGVGFGEG